MATFYALTSQGNAELKSAGTSLSSRELEILVLVDWHGDRWPRSSAASASVPHTEVMQVLQKLADTQLIARGERQTSALETRVLQHRPCRRESSAAAQPPSRRPSKAPRR
jgi:hypothetical protein